MRKSLYAVLAALFVLIAVSGCTQVRFVNPNEGETETVPAGTAIETLDELKKAATGYGEYYLANDIILDEQLTITGEITLNGNGHTISRAAANTGDGPGTRATLLIKSSNVIIKNITVDGLDTIKGWTDGEYAIKAYSESDHLTGIVFEDIEIVDSNAGMLIRGANVTLKGNIVLDDVEFGGIGVDSKGNDSLKSSLDVSDCKFKSTPILRDKPAIWKEDKNALNETVTGWKDANLKEIVGTGNDDNQTYYVTRGFKG